MAREIKVNDDKAMEAFRETLFRAIQSSHFNFLLGAGASSPGVTPAGNVEAEILGLLKAGKGNEADKKAIQFLRQFKDPMTKLVGGATSGPVADTLKHYVTFIQAIDALLSERKTNLLPRQASIFTTNYDPFIERASEQCPSIILNDGFNRLPNLTGIHRFAPEKLFDATVHTGNHYDYTAELPSINLIKMHGSLTWSRADADIVFKLLDFGVLDGVDDNDEAEVSKALEEVAIVLPTQRKFQQTIIERTYYDLLRIFANVMEREGSLLIAFGFSFRDEHVLEVVKRALRNPTLKLIACCYDPGEVGDLRTRFASYNNVTLLAPAKKGDLDFAWLNKTLTQIIAPKAPA